MPIARKPKRTRPRYDVVAPKHQMSAIALRQVRDVLGEPRIDEHMVKDFFERVYLRHCVLEEELAKVPKSADIALAWRGLQDQASQIALAVGSFDGASLAAATRITTEAGAIAAELEQLKTPPRRRQYAALRAGLPFALMELSQLHQSATEAASARPIRRLSDALFIELKALAVAVPSSSKRFFDLIPQAATDTSITSAEMWEITRRSSNE